MMTFRREAYEAMLRHAAEAYPAEGCGLLVGSFGDGGITVERAEAARNMRQDRPRDRYEIDPMDYLRIDRRAEEDGLEVVGFYHSHPDGEPVPSAVDVERSWPVFRYVIVAVRDGETRGARAWVFSEDRRGYREEPVAVEGG